jgi:hypothetical protein
VETKRVGHTDESEMNEAAVAVQDDPAYQAYLNEPLAQAGASEEIIVKPEPLKNQRLDQRDERAARLRDIVKDFTAKAFALMGQVRQDFMDKGDDEKILGCATWSEYCENVLGYSESHVRNMMAQHGTNPAKKFAAKKPHKKEAALPKLKQSFPTAPSARNAEWTDDLFIRTCVRFVETTLKPLESDPQRFVRVAAAIAAEIVDEIGDDRSTRTGASELAAVAQ